MKNAFAFVVLCVALGTVDAFPRLDFGGAGCLRARVAFALLLVRLRPHSVREMHFFRQMLLATGAPPEILSLSHARFTSTRRTARPAGMIPL